MDDKNSNIHYEFGGPIGALGVIVGLPVVIYLLYFACNKDVCLENPFEFDIPAFLDSLPKNCFQLFSGPGTAIYLGWLLFNVLLERILPGETAEGVTLPNGKRLRYTLSGHLQFWICILAMGHAVPLIKTDPNDSRSFLTSTYYIEGFTPLRLDMLYDHYVPLISISIVFTTLFSLYLYIASFLPTGKILAKGGNTGNALYDFFIGRELNPRWGSLDLKEFCELRPGLIGWFVINLGMATKQYLNRRAENGVGSITMSMLLTTAFQGLYVWDALYMERAILTTMDITTDGFGFMLCFGDLAWVPFIYTLQARYLVDHDPELSLLQICLISGLHFLGYFIFRSANSEKDSFRRNPDSSEVKHLKYLQTKRGTKLLTSGWWGAARKINYTGDWLVTLSWCLLCGFKSPVPYFQAIYFLILLIHRAIRDDQMCHEKYGEDWEEYKRRVPYMFIPYVI